MSWWKDPSSRFGVLSLGASIVGAVALGVGSYQYGPVGAWLLVVSVVTFLTYAYDKGVSKYLASWMRVPESVLLTLIVVGGTLGGLLGMWVFSHKTAKRSFLLKVLSAILVQGALLVVYLKYVDHA